jgi:acetolactate synthase-1/2/3 large subunit
MNQIRHGQIANTATWRSTATRATVSATRLGSVRDVEFARTLGGYGGEVRDPRAISAALLRACESGLPSLINVWVVPDAHASGSMKPDI